MTLDKIEKIADLHKSGFRVMSVKHQCELCEFILRAMPVLRAALAVSEWRDTHAAGIHLDALDQATAKLQEGG